ncbi:MAG: tetratricopeptide repeat protein, partial [Elusimicrobia bacterium]|nr:tetratricopeptide repeat protein [Elusimicrobiota bacterium]
MGPRAFVMGAVLVLGPFLVPAVARAEPPDKPDFTADEQNAIGIVGPHIPGYPEILADPIKLAEAIEGQRRAQARIPQATFDLASAALLRMAEKNGMVKPDPNVAPKPVGGGDAPVAVTPTAPERYFRAVAQRRPNEPEVHVELGKYSYARKDYETALSDYERAIKLDPSNQAALLGYGHSANELGDYRLAAMAAKQLLARDGGNREALGLYHFATGRAPTVSLPSSIFQAGAAAPGGSGAAGVLAPQAAGGVPG